MEILTAPGPLITNKKLKADFVSEADKVIKESSLSVCRIKLGMLFCRLAITEHWDFKTEIQPICEEAFNQDRMKTGQDVGLGTFLYLQRYCE